MRTGIIVVLLGAAVSAFAGAIMDYERASCGYYAGGLFLGGGKSPGFYYILAYCPEREEFCAALKPDDENGEAVCPSCGTTVECEREEWVRTDDEGNLIYKYPKCGESAVEERRTGLWD